jgi:hypothetical protein
VENQTIRIWASKLFDAKIIKESTLYIFNEMEEIYNKVITNKKMIKKLKKQVVIKYGKIADTLIDLVYSLPD